MYSYYWKDSDLLKELTDSVTAGIELPRRKQIAIYNFVRDSIRTQELNGTGAILYYQRADDVIENRSGTPVEKNLLLISMLKKAGIDARPYLVGSRDYSMFSEANRSISQFNNLLCLSNLNNHDCILDTRNPKVIYPYLDPRLQSEGGLEINETGSEVVEPEPYQWPGETKVLSSVRVTAAGAAICSTRVMLRGFAQLNLPADEDKELTVDDIEAMLPLTSLDHVENFHAGTVERDNADSCWLNFTMEMPDYLAFAGDKAFARCSIIWSQPSPFKNNERTYPIDFRYPRDYEEVVNIYVDSSLAVDSPPEPGRTSFGGLTYSRMPITGDHDARIVTHLKIDTPFFMPSDYAGVKKFFEDVYGFNSGELVMRRSFAGTDQ